MKKLMSFLIISSFTALLTVNETSCFCSRRREPPTSKISIKNQEIAPIDASKDDVRNNAAEHIYIEIRTQIASWANDDVTQADIKTDNNITLEVYDGTSLIEETSDYEFQTKTYTAKITIADGDEYFKEQDETEYSFEINRLPVDISTKRFSNFYSDPANDVYTNIATEVASWAIPATDEVAINADSKITIGLYDGNTYIDPTDTTVLSDGTYTVKITVDSGDEYFKEQAETEYNLDITSIEQKDISGETFDDFLKPGDEKGSDLYDNIFEQVANWHSNTVTASDIENDLKITILIKFPNGNSVINSSSQNLDLGTYTVKITVDSGDTYFKEQAETDYALEVIYKVNIEYGYLASYWYDNPGYGSGLWAHVYKEIAEWYSPNLTAEDIINDENFTINYIKDYWDNDVPNDDAYTPLFTGLDYTVNITVKPEDQYFQAIDDLDRNITTYENN